MEGRNNMYNFICKCRQFGKDIYRIDDRDLLNQQLKEVNQIYDEIMASSDITTMEKEYILSKFIKIDKLTMYDVPVIKRSCEDVDNKYRRYHVLDE